MDINKKLLKRFIELSSQSYSIIKTINKKKFVDIREFSGWGISALNILENVFGQESLHYQYFHEEYVSALDGDLASADICFGILQSAYKDYENGYIFKIRSILTAELGDTLIEKAKSLLKGGHKNISCVVCGISLELAVKNLCENNDISIPEKSKTEQLNIELRKSNVYNESMRKQISYWLALRNYGAHGDWDEYSDQDINLMINGVERFIGEFL